MRSDFFKRLLCKTSSLNLQAISKIETKKQLYQTFFSKPEKMAEPTTKKVMRVSASITGFYTGFRHNKR